MKVSILKTLLLASSATIMFGLTGCGSEGIPSDDNLVSDVSSVTPTPVPTPTPPVDNSPVITLIDSNPMDVPICSTWTDPGATADDKEDGDLTSKIVTTGTVDTSTLGTYAVTYTVTDSAGNTTTEKRTINVVSPDSLLVSKVVKKTGQSQSYDELGNPVSGCPLKDDGFYKVGVARSFTQANDMVTDNVTGLIWEDTPHSAGGAGNMLTQRPVPDVPENAESYCASLTLGGLGWRLPTITELLTVSDRSKFQPPSEMFKNNYIGPLTQGALYWSKTILDRKSGETGNAITYRGMKTTDGRDMHWNVTYAWPVRCVNADTSKLPSAPALSRANDIVTDTNTNLQWTDDAATAQESGTWQEAIDYCENTCIIGGFTDWRLPNVFEFYTLSDPSTHNPATTHGVFQNLKLVKYLGHYWTSTTIVEKPNSAWTFEFYNGSDSWSEKINGGNPPQSAPGDIVDASFTPPHNVMCVRNK